MRSRAVGLAEDNILPSPEELEEGEEGGRAFR